MKRLRFVSDDHYFLAGVKYLDFGYTAITHKVNSSHNLRTLFSEMQSVIVKEECLVIFLFHSIELSYISLSCQRTLPLTGIHLVDLPVSFDVIFLDKVFFAWGGIGICELKTLIQKIIKPQKPYLKKLHLTQREKTTIPFLIKGVKIDSIALRMNVSPKTIYSFKYSLIEKTGMKNRNHQVFIRFLRLIERGYNR